MSTPEFIVELRRHIGHALLWLPGVTAVVMRPVALRGDESPESREDAPSLDNNPVPRGDGASGPRADGTEVLLVKRADTGAWTPVTGIVDPGEDVADAAVREVLEETAVRARATRLVRVHTMDPVTYANGDRAQYVDLTFACEWVSGEPYPADGENTEARWFAVDALPDLSAEMLARIDAATAGDPRARFAGGDAPDAGEHVP